ncbi:hypothetical protein GEMRC1_008311 [Eukaryota sp. GEM-RC1]
MAPSTPVDRPPALTHLLLSHKKACNDILQVDATHCVSASDDKTLVLWQVSGTQGIPLFVLPFPTAVSSVAFCAEKQVLAVGQENGLVSFVKHSERNLDIVLTIPAHSKRVSAIVYDRTKNRFLSVAYDKKISIIPLPDALSKETPIPEVRSQPIASAWPGCMALTPKGDRLFIGTFSREVIVADIQDDDTIEVSGTLHGHRGSVRSCVFDPVTSFLMTGSFDKLVFAWETTTRLVSTMRPIARLAAHSKKVKAMAIDTKKRLLASACDGGMVALYELKSGKRLRFFQVSKTKVLSLCIFGDKLFTGDHHGVIRVWDLRDKEEVEVEVDGHDHEVTVVEEKTVNEEESVEVNEEEQIVESSQSDIDEDE